MGGFYRSVCRALKLLVGWVFDDWHATMIKHTRLVYISINTIAVLIGATQIEGLILRRKPTPWRGCAQMTLQGVRAHTHTLLNVSMEAQILTFVSSSGHVDASLRGWSVLAQACKRSLSLTHTLVCTARPAYQHEHGKALCVRAPKVQATHFWPFAILSDQCKRIRSVHPSHRGEGADGSLSVQADNCHMPAH